MKDAHTHRISATNSLQSPRPERLRPLATSPTIETSGKNSCSYESGRKPTGVAYSIHSLGRAPLDIFSFAV